METPSHNYYEDGDFILRLQPLYDYILLHCEVNVWNSRVLRNMYTVFGNLINEAEVKGYKKLVTITPNPNFARLFGAITTSHFEHDGKHYEVMQWELN